MVKKLKQTISEKFLLIFVIILTIVFFGSFIAMKNKCLFVKSYDPKNSIVKTITNTNNNFSDIVCFNFFTI